MIKEKIAIIGGGIVGSTAAYYLTRNGYSVTLFDEGTGQATRAAAGIICPWFTLRRNQPWYFLVSNGAEFYRQLINDLTNDGYPTADLFQEQGALIIRKNQKSLERDLEQGAIKREKSPSIQEIQTIHSDELTNIFPLLNTPFDATYVQGGARVDGEALIDTLHTAIEDLGGIIIKEKATLKKENTINTKSLGEKIFAKTLLSAGAWLPDLLTPLGYQVDIRPQKGQLYTIYSSEWQDKKWPVVMPPGKVDIIPNDHGEIVIGATHEDDGGYDLTLDPKKLAELTEHAKNWIPNIDQYPIHSTRVGIRAYTSDYAVLVGAVPEMKHTWAVSGLGSSGLTSGPYIGYQWAQLIMTGTWTLNEKDYPIQNYLTKKTIS